MEELKLDVETLKKGALVLRAVDNKLRQKILRLINKHKKITVTTIYETLGIEQPVASQHLSILRSQGFVKYEREGRFFYYSINHKRFEELEVLIVKVSGKSVYCEPYQLKGGVMVVRKRV